MITKLFAFIIYLTLHYEKNCHNMNLTVSDCFVMQLKVQVKKEEWI